MVESMAVSMGMKKVVKLEDLTAVLKVVMKAAVLVVSRAYLMAHKKGSY
jgi:hypothetical protein